MAARSSWISRPSQSAAVAKSRRSRESDVGIFWRAWTLQPDARLDVERRRCAAISSTRRRGSTSPISPPGSTSQHSRVGVFAAHRRGEPEPALISSLPEIAKADDGGRRAALLRSVRAARRLGEPRVHAGRGAETHRRGGCAAGRRVCRGDQSRVQRALDRSDAQRREALRAHT